MLTSTKKAEFRSRNFIYYAAFSVSLVAFDASQSTRARAPVSTVAADIRSSLHAISLLGHGTGLPPGQLAVQVVPSI